MSKTWEIVEVLARKEAYLAELLTPRPNAEWHEDMGDVLWWKFPITEAPWCGTPLDGGWPGYHTHWTPVPAPVSPKP